METPGTTWGPIISSTSDASAPAILILTISSGDLIDTGIVVLRLFVNVVLAEIKLSFGSRKLDSPEYCKAEFVIGIG